MMSLFSGQLKVPASQRRAAVTVEYALMIVAVVGVIAVSGSLLGSRVNRSLRRVASVPDAATAPVSQSTIGQPTAPSHSAPVLELSVWVMLGQTFTMLAIITWVLLERRKRLRQLDEENAVAEPLFTEDRGRHVFAKRQQIFKTLSNNLHVLLGSKIEVRHLMSDRITTVSPELSADEVRELMHEQHIRHLLVVDQQEKLVGIISDRDLTNDQAATAAELMTANPRSIEVDSLVNPAITQMVKRRISALPVLSDGKLCGVLTTTDLMMALQCCLQVLQSMPQAYDDSDDVEESFVGTSMSSPCAAS